MTKSKEGILGPLWFYANKKSPSNKEVCVIEHDQALKAMEEYAKQQSIAWSHFLDDGFWRKNKKSDMWFDNNFNFVSESDLYTIFLSHQSKAIRHG